MRRRIKPGSRYGKLTIVRYDAKANMYDCLCDCGRECRKSGVRLHSNGCCFECYKKTIEYRRWRLPVSKGI